MKVDMKIGTVGVQNLIEDIGQGDFILNMAPPAPGPERDAALAGQIKKLLDAVEALPDRVLAAEDKAELRKTSQALTVEMPPSERKQGVEIFFTTLRKCFGETATIAAMAMNLARLLY